MNQKGLADAIAAKLNKSKKEAEEFLQTTLETIEETVASGEPVKLICFGTFSRRKVKGSERECKLPTAKGKIIKTEDTFKPVFKAGKEFEDAVKGIKG